MSQKPQQNGVWTVLTTDATKLKVHSPGLDRDGRARRARIVRRDRSDDPGLIERRPGR